MWSAIASAIRLSFCGALNTQRFSGVIGTISEAEAAITTCGTPFSAATVLIAAEAGVADEPIDRVDVVLVDQLAHVGDPAGGVGAVVEDEVFHGLPGDLACGRMPTVLRWGMPSEAAGPVADTL